MLYVNNVAPRLAPIFRSEVQLHVLGATFLEPDREFSIPDLMERSDRSQPTVAREVQRLADAGLLTSRLRHGRRVVQANEASPIFGELRALLLKTIGPKAVIEDVLRSVAGIERAFIYGSWARRYLGEPGPLPEDVDLMVIGDPDVSAVREAADMATLRIQHDVNVTILDAVEFASSRSGFVDQVKRQPIVDIDLG